MNYNELKEEVIHVAVDIKNAFNWDIDYSLNELDMLASTCKTISEL